uniref:Uncharacterized protein LOC110221847 n=1 Tax=Phascolarctos cinereus TaxID=38626 RepID=A0A6P5M0Y7_PHACI|nr:uncharacterized protein LOC110221847 [Phascolarctos cinereus]
MAVMIRGRYLKGLRGLKGRRRKGRLNSGSSGGDAERLRGGAKGTREEEQGGTRWGLEGRNREAGGGGRRLKARAPGRGKGVALSLLRAGPKRWSCSPALARARLWPLISKTPAWEICDSEPESPASSTAEGPGDPEEARAGSRALVPLQGPWLLRCESSLGKGRGERRRRSQVLHELRPGEYPRTREAETEGGIRGPPANAAEQLPEKLGRWAGPPELSTGSAGGIRTKSEGALLDGMVRICYVPEVGLVAGKPCHSSPRRCWL